MIGVFKWLRQTENMFFALHVVLVVILAAIAEVFLPNWTSFAYPALILIGAVSFMLNYPLSSIKEHGLFSEYLIELRLLWFIMLSAFGEYLVFQFIEKTQMELYAVIALVVALIALFYARSFLQEKIVQARGFK